MSGPENFLSRWSRRKREATESPADSADAWQRDTAEHASAHHRESGDLRPQSPDSRSKISAEGSSKPDKAAEPEFDLSKLPPIESITAETDIRAYLAPGVPPALTRAALRRAWVADSKIRDFIGLAENQWDFTAPGGAPGFDLSPPTGDIARMVSEILRGTADESAAAPSLASGENAIEPVAPRETSVRVPASHRIVNKPADDGEQQKPVSEEQGTPPPPIAQHKQDVAALQNDDASQNDEGHRRRRTHGGAIPR